MNDLVTLHAEESVERERSDDDDELLWKIYDERQARLKTRQPIGAREGGGDDADAPLDLRVNRPKAYDLQKLWALTGKPVPPEIAAALGSKTPILVEHIVTPFAPDGRAPAGVWALGYEFVLTEGEADTKSVAPNDEVLKIGEVGQKVELGLSLGGSIGTPELKLTLPDGSVGVALSGASLSATTDQKFQFSLQMLFTLRKVIGAPVGIGGALWKLYRQDEPLDRPHFLYQTMLVPEGAQELNCTLKTWARKAGLFGTRLFSRTHKYPEQAYRVSLAGLPTTPAGGAGG